MNEPSISVLMTAYNRERYVGTAIESVLASSFKNFELIVVDDCSKDKTLDIARYYAGIDTRVTVYRNENNLGDYPNRNMAASYARGKYIKYVDADDYLYPHGLEQMWRYMELPEHDDVALGIFGLRQDDLHPYPIKLTSRESLRRHFVDQIFTFGVAPLSTIIRKSIFDIEGGFKNQRMVGDFECWTRLALKYPIAIIPVVGCWYRKHDAQEMNHVSKFAGDGHRIVNNVIDTAERFDFFTALEARKIRKRFASGFLKAIVRRSFANRGLGELQHNLRTSGRSIKDLIKSAL